MARDTITYSLDGTVSLGNFRTAINAFTDLVEMLTDQTKPDAKVRWVVSDLKYGSTLVTTRGIPESEEDFAVVTQVVEEADRIGEIAASNDYVGWTEYPRPIRQQVAAMFGMLNGHIPKAHLGSYTIEAPVEVEPPQWAKVAPTRRERTSIKGQVVTLDSKRGTYFTLKEIFTNRLIRCWPEPSYKTRLAELWKSGDWVLVEGYYNTFTKQPTVTDITDIVSLGAGKEKGAWRKVFGISPRQPGDSTLSVNDIVRKVRDGG